MPEVMQGAGQGLVKTSLETAPSLGWGCGLLGDGGMAGCGSCAGRRHGPSRPWPCTQVHSRGSVNARSLGDPVCPTGGAVLG